MTTNAKQAFQLLIIVLCFVTLGAWCASVGSLAVIWALRLGAPAAIIPVVYWFFSLSRRPDSIPDLLRQSAGRYFERKGLCFAPVLDVVDGTCRLNLFFQNRYTGHASTIIQLKPPMRSFWISRHALPTVTAAIECPGGAFGVLRFAFPIPAKYQGKRMAFDVGADTKYHAHRGKLLRHREGIRVGSISELGQGHALGLVLLGLPLLGALVVSRAAKARMVFPTGVAETLPPDAQTGPEILWQPELQTGGFPVILGKAAA